SEEQARWQPSAYNVRRRGALGHGDRTSRSPQLPRPAGLAKSTSLGAGAVQLYDSFAQTGNLRLGGPDASGGGFNPAQHRRRLSASGQGRQGPFPQYCGRLTRREPLLFTPGSRSWLRRNSGAPYSTRRNQPYAQSLFCRYSEFWLLTSAFWLLPPDFCLLAPSASPSD